MSAENRARCDRWHAGVVWTGSDWSNAMCGEAGEAANIVKKLRRHETYVGSSYNTPPRDELTAKLWGELADVILYADLVAHHYDIDLEEAVIIKFNQVSIAQGFPERLS